MYIREHYISLHRNTYTCSCPVSTGVSTSRCTDTVHRGRTGGQPLLGQKFFFSSVISNQNIKCSMSWCAGCLSWWGPLQRGDLCRGFNQLLTDVWLLVREVSNLSLIQLTTQIMVTTGILPLQGNIPVVEPGIEPGTSWLVVRSSDH